jgi:CelD/BcsL family acetyltransferase involved in cellulose biosynthesis
MANNQFEIHRKVTDICPRIILPDTIQQEQATLDPRLSQWLDRIEHNPEIEIEDRSSNGQVAGTLQMLSHVHQKRWNAQGYPGLFSDQRFEDFQRNLAQALARRDRIWMKNLVYQGNNLATHMGFTFNGHVYTYLSDHDQTQSPDPTTATVTENPVLWELVQDAITANKQVVDLGRGSADYKFDWASTMNRNWELRIRTSPSKQLAAKMSYVKQRGYYHIRQLHSRIRYETHILQTLTEEHGHGWALPTYLIKAARRFMQRLQWEQQRYKLKNPHPSISAQDWPKSSKLAPVKLNRNFRSDTYTEAVDSHNESDFRLDIIRTPSDLPVIQSSWDALATSMGSPMLSYPWFYASSMAFGGRSPLYVMTLKDKKDNIRAIAPLGRKESMPPRFELLGSSILREPSSLLYTDPVALRVAIQKMLDLNQPITLRGLRLYGPVSKILEQELKQRSYRSKKSSARIPYVAIRKSWEEFEREDISSSRRSSFRRLKRKAEKHGPLRLEVVTPTPENVASYLEQVYRIEAANWKGRAGTAIQTHPTLNVFFRILAHQMAEQGRLRLYFLNVGDKMVAVQYNLMYDQQLWIYKIGYDEQWAWCSPGILLMHEVIKHSFAQSLEAVEFLGTDASWLHIWATDWHSLRSYELYPKNVVGSLARPRDLLQQAYHKIEARIRERRAMNI